MKNNSIFVFAGIFLFIFFTVLSFLVAEDLFSGFDFDTTVRIQNFLPEKVTGIFSSFSLLGTVEIASLFSLLVLFIFKIPKKIFVLIFYVLTGVIEVSGKILIEHSGPPIMFLKTKLAVNFPSSYIPHEFFSYPSGHAARTSFISVVLLLAIWRSSKISKELKLILVFLILAFDFLMFLSRVYLGEHWSTDVIGGALLGFSLAALSLYFVIKRT